MLLEWIGINKYTIKLVDDKKPSYRSIYSLNSVELKTFKTYIKTNLANGFIWPLKSSIGASIFLSVSLIVSYACMSIIKV